MSENTQIGAENVVESGDRCPLVPTLPPSLVRIGKVCCSSILLALFVVYMSTYSSRAGMSNRVYFVSSNSTVGDSSALTNRPQNAFVQQTINSTDSPGNLERRLPSVIIIGAKKGGTRALLEFLSLHPLIVGASKEIHFFDTDEDYVKGLEFYRSQMPPSLPNQITMEKSPRYFISQDAPRRLYQDYVVERNMTVKLILIVKEPVARIVSDCAQFCAHYKAAGKKCPNFESRMVDQKTGKVNVNFSPVEISTYHKHFDRWRTFFPGDNLLVVDGDRFILEPQETLYNLEELLGLPHMLKDVVYFNSTKGFYCKVTGSFGHGACLDDSKGRKHQKLSNKTLMNLQTFFHPLNELFFKAVGKRFPWNY